MFASGFKGVINSSRCAYSRWRNLTDVMSNWAFSTTDVNTKPVACRSTSLMISREVFSVVLGISSVFYTYGPLSLVNHMVNNQKGCFQMVFDVTLCHHLCHTWKIWKWSYRSVCFNATCCFYETLWSVINVCWQTAYRLFWITILACLNSHDELWVGGEQPCKFQLQPVGVRVKQWRATLDTV